MKHFYDQVEQAPAAMVNIGKAEWADRVFTDLHPVELWHGI